MIDDVQENLLRTIDGPAPEALERLIYVVGSARGGSSITQAIIGLHESVIAMSGPSSFLNHVWRYRTKLHDRLWRQLLWTPGYLRRAAVRDALPRERSEAYTRLINRAAVEKDLHNLYRLYPLTKALDPDEARDPSSFKAWLDKGNDFWGVDELPKAFPRGRFVFVVRDPRGAIGSIAKRSAGLRADTQFKTEPRDIIVAAIYWRNLVRQQLRFARRHPDQTVFFRFEDLTSRPVELTQSLFTALDLPAKSKDEIKRQLDAMSYTASNDAGESKGISTEPNERWKTTLDPLSLELIAEICGSSARVLGYDLSTTAKRRGWFGLLGFMYGMKEKLRTLAKLIFLCVTDRPSGSISNSPAMRLMTEGRA